MAYNFSLFGDGHSFDRVVSKEGTEFIARFEDFVDHWYEDGVWKSGPKKGEPKYSCCYGHLEGGENWPFVYDPNQTFTHDEGIAIFQSDLESKAKYVRSKVKVPINTFMFNALISLVFNYGEGNIDNDKDGNARNLIWPALNVERYVQACAEFRHFNMQGGKEINGLIIRRGCEMALFSTKIMKPT